MARLSKHDKGSISSSTSAARASSESVSNFMGGTSFKLNPISTLKIVASSSIFGEPQYYRASGTDTAIPSIKNILALREYSLSGLVSEKDRTVADVFTRAIDNALSFDFKKTLELALELRKDYFMRLNPAVIFVRANQHPFRKEFNESNPGFMRSIGKEIAMRPDDITNQLEYYMFLNGSKSKLSSFMKRTWAARLEEFSRYQLNKYKGKKLIDLVRISHANSSDIDELMQTGTVKVTETEMTWESLKSQGKTWKEILTQIDLPHMALLRNLRGIFSEDFTQSETNEILDSLKKGVPNGKQFPFRYFTAYRAISESDINSKYRVKVLDTLENCMDIAVSNMPKLKGNTVCLSDNSGSAWGAINSEYGSVKIAEIANLSSLITALQSEDGEIGLFGDNLVMKPISRRAGLLSQLMELNDVEKKHRKVGGGTENGIWVFFRDAIKNKQHYDNIFIYSDQQAGHGGLYGISPNEYRSFIHKRSNTHIDVLSLIEEYRKKVNARANVFTVQVAGYDNTVFPENIYRGAILGGWTGKEAIFAKALIDTWNQID